MIDLFLEVSQVAFADVQQPVAKHACRTGYFIDEVPRCGGLRGGENFAPLGFLRIARRSGFLAFDLDQRGGDVTQQSDRDLAVEIHILDELRDVGVTGIDG